MALTQGLAGFGTTNDTGDADVLGSPAEEVMSIWLRCDTASANSLLFRCHELHGATGPYAKLEAGAAVVLRASSYSDADNLKTVDVKALDNTNVASVSWAVCAKNVRT